MKKQTIINIETTKQCSECKKIISIIEWNNHRQQLFGGNKPITVITEMIYSFYECPSCKAQLNYYQNLGFK